MTGQTNFKILGIIKKMLENGQYEPYVHDLDGTAVEVNDTAVVTCFYGTDSSRLEATVKALSLFKKYKAIPSKVILVEAQCSENDIKLQQFSNQMGFTYIFIKTGDSQRGLFIKQHLFNIATRYTDERKFIYLDSDVGFCNPYWIKNVSLALDKFGIMQPFTHAYFAYCGKYEPARDKVEMSALKRFIDSNDREFSSVTGFAWAMTREAFDRLGGMDVLSSPSEDIWFWHTVCGMTSNRLSGLPYQLFLDDCMNRKCTDMQIGTIDEICFHVEHGTPASRRYSAYIYACNRQNPDPLCDVKYDKKSGSLPKWKDDIWARVRKRTIELIQHDDDSLHEDHKSSKSRANDAINQANREVFGPLKKKLKVVTLLDAKHTEKDVLSHKRMFEKFMKDDFEYVCLSNTKINGIKTAVKTKSLSYRFSVIDVFRKDVSGDGCICLYASLDVIPVSSIEICNVPDGFIGLNNPRHSGKFEGSWILYLCNSMLFSGDFSFIYRNYIDENTDFPYKKLFMNPENCIAYNLYAKGIDIRAMSQFVDLRNVRCKRTEDYSEYISKVQTLVDKDEWMYTQLAAGNFI